MDGVDADLIDPDGYYYPVTTTPLVLMGNADYDNMPSDWTDLTKDEYKGLYQLHNLGGGTAKTVFASIISVIRIRTEILAFLMRDGKSQQILR